MNQPIAEVFQFCPRCGTPATKQGANPFHCSRCDYAHYFSPITAVGAIIADESGRVLFITRAKDPGKGKLGLPGGFVDPGERLEIALKREVLEEVNLQSTSIEYLTSFPNSYAYQGAIFPVTDAFFLVRVDSFDSIAAQEGEVSDYQFSHPTETVLSNMAFKSNRLALEVYLSQGSDKDD